VKKRIIVIVAMFAMAFSLSFGSTAWSSDSKTDTAPSKKTLTAEEQRKADAAAIYPGVINIVTPNAAGDAVNTVTKAPAFADIGVAGWPLQIIANAGDSGIDYLRFEVAPKTDFPIHGGDDPISVWLCFVEKGGGEFILADKNKKETSRVTYKAGDFFIVKNAWHGWHNGDAPSSIVALKLSKPAK
jgi:hypothetical protein